MVVFVASVIAASAQTPSKSCSIEPVNYKGWNAQQVSNQWVQLIIVPQNGGRLMQVTFSGHPYLFVNPQFAGKYLPPTTGKWFNYGGDKIWLMPEGNDDEQHWVGDSDELDDGPFGFQKISEGKRCIVELTGPTNSPTGIQFSRTIAIDADSPVIHFHASMKNISGHPVEWSMQTVSQYNTANLPPDKGPPINHNFWSYTPANPASTYLNRYHVRFGPAENRSVSVQDDGFFALHYVHMAAELWIDSPDGWLSVTDRSTQYAMVERFQHDATRPYPGKATVIFWTNGPETRLSDEGEVSISNGADQSPYYQEAEINSPMCKLHPGESCNLDTEWYPTRCGDEFHGVSDAGLTVHPLQAVAGKNGSVKLSGTFGVFFAGRLEGHFYDEHGAPLANVPMQNVSPTEPVLLDQEVSAAKATRISLHLIDESGLDRGSLGEVRVQSTEAR